MVIQPFIVTLNQIHGNFRPPMDKFRIHDFRAQIAMLLRKMGDTCDEIVSRFQSQECKSMSDIVKNRSTQALKVIAPVNRLFFISPKKRHDVCTESCNRTIGGSL